MNDTIETVIIGAGHAGVAMSYCLTQLGREHIVLERRRPFERWRSERWDSLHLIIPNWLIYLPGLPNPTPNPDGFMHHHDYIRYLEDYLTFSRAPVRSGVNVTALDAGSGSCRYRVVTNEGAIDTENVVIATGPYQVPLIPAFAERLPKDIVQIPSGSYRNPDRLPPGAVLVVGAGASGSQIADELNRAGRTVYLSIGRHRRAPRRYRGRDHVWWSDRLGLLDRTVDELRAAPPGHPGTGASTGIRGGYDIDFRRFAAEGMILLGRVRDARAGKIEIAPDLAENLAKGDEAFVEFTTEADIYALKNHLELPPAESDPNDPARFATPLPDLREVDLRSRGITSVIWATGFGYDFGWIHLPILDEKSQPIQRRGVTSQPGVYFLGLRLLHTARSSIVSGAGQDAEYIAQHLAGLRQESPAVR